MKYFYFFIKNSDIFVKIIKNNLIFIKNKREIFKIIENN